MLVVTGVLVYLTVICRVSICLIFTFSFISKALHFSEFSRSLDGFRLLPPRSVKPVALLLMASELSVVILLIAGSPFSEVGLLLASSLLLLFSAAIASALIRDINTSCNCFGPNTERISQYELWRNGVLLVCGLVGLTPMFMSPLVPISLGFIEWVLVGLAAAAITVVLTNLRSIVQVLQMN